jgi:hypothetical protein
MSGGYPEEVIDCEAEKHRFEDLLRFATPRRIMTVSDDSGWGKSTFVRTLRHLCQFQYKIPVALVPLEDFENRPDELALVTDVVQQLEDVGVQFPSFDKLTRARSLHDVAIFAEGLGSVDASGAVISESDLAVTMFKIENIEQFNKIGAPDWSEEADRQAKRLCVEAFLTELFETACERPIVIIFDTVESAHEKLKDWLFLTLVNHRILEHPGGEHMLLVVLAGRKLEAALKSRFSDYGFFFDSISSLGTWEKDDTVRLFAVHGLGGLDHKVVDFLHERIAARDVSLTRALAIAAAFETGWRGHEQSG